jgi:predicted membrane-bound dolichyl-phosphate-mannose-protein mannosyltransferase
MSQVIQIEQLPSEVVVFMKTVAVRFANEVALQTKIAELKQKRIVTLEYQKRKEIRQQMRALTDNTPLSEYRKLAKEVGRLTRTLDKNFKSEKAEIQEIKETIITLNAKIIKDLATEPIKSIVSQ